MKSSLSVTLVAALLAGCSLTGGSSDEQSTAEDGTTPGEVVLVTHESFNLPKPLVKQFEEESGLDLEIRSAGDAGALTTRLAVTADNPTGDVAFGVDNTFASRALEEDVFDTLDVELPAGADDYVLPGDDGQRLAPVDNGNVCVNVDATWFEERDLAPPESLDDLADPAYEGLFVTPSALSSSPGLAFLLATVAAYGEDWPTYWEDLLANDALVVDGWTDAYYGDFTQGGEGGTRPIVLSYDSSPAFTVPKGSDESTTEALLDTCFRQVEYAGVLAGAANPEGGRELVEFLLGEDVQAALPGSMYVFPVRDGVALPEEWAAHAEQPADPYAVDPDEIAANRDAWLEEWRDLVTG
ncbi:thiamine ABC transporter substrate-binding protein [Nocardioides euryhalodurans]|uniref:Thiamine ABC transporter substrate-binding protein n=1 Tax=Nocardioides euryhalodurans TaxID=2518370 RepID=A0A4P7GLJ0_9ACTN|nr:thiamine ABC transporter substrate-binding protein [Nocardioides euryhalodurans]QBR92581.1 thiamine ABC transporter substrate-binding protein [Nocardioides euryhalodurans]